MADKNPYLVQAENKINQMIEGHLYKDAYELCKKVLEKIPQDGTFLKLKEKIEEDVANENKKIANKKMKEIKGMFNDGQYKEVLQELKPFITATPTRKLVEFYRKTQELYKKTIIEDKYGKINELKNRFSGLAKKDPERLATEISILEKNNLGNMEIQDVVRKYKVYIIRQKIKENKDLLYSKNYKEITKLLEKLKRIDPRSDDITEIEKKIKSNINTNQTEEKREAVYKGINYMENLIGLKKYDKAIKVGGELLQMDENNSTVKNLLSNAENKFFKQTKEEAIKAIEDGKQLLKEEYTKDSTHFVEI